MYILEKLSNTGWEKKYETKEEAVEELRKWICKGCIEGDPSLPDIFPPVEDESDAGELLSTSCGCEFDLYKEGEIYGR